MNYTSLPDFEVCLYKGKNNVSWVYGGIVPDSTNKSYRICGIDEEGIRTYSVDQRSICPWSGVINKDADLIFHLDVLYDSESYEHYVVVVKNGFSKCCVYNSAIGELSPDIDLVNLLDLPIVGNLFDSPEILDSMKIEAQTRDMVSRKKEGR